MINPVTTDDLKNIEPAPDWLRCEVKTFLKHLGFGEWDTEVNVCDMPEVSGHLATWGGTHTDSTYLTAIFYFDRRVTELNKHDIYHECLHVALSELEYIVKQIIAALPGDKTEAYAGLFQWQLERTIERLARAFFKTKWLVNDDTKR